MLAIDPTSPFSGGAILGDRVRMQDHATDPERVHPLDGHPRPPRRPGPRRAGGHPPAGRRRASRGSSWRPSASARSRSRSPGRPTPPSSSSTRGGATPCRPTRPASWRSPTSSSSTRPTGPAWPRPVGTCELMLDLSDLGDWRPPIVTAVATDGTGIADVWSAVEDHRESHREGRPAAAASRRARPQELRQIVAQRLEARARELCQGTTYDELERSRARARARPVGRHRRAARRRRRLSAVQRDPGPRGSTA